MQNQIESLRNKEVEVVYRDFIYKGILRDILESEILLDVNTQMITIPFEDISSIREITPNQHYS